LLREIKKSNNFEENLGKVAAAHPPEKTNKQTKMITKLHNPKKGKIIAIIDKYQIILLSTS